MLTPAEMLEIEILVYQSAMENYQQSIKALKDLGWIAVPSIPESYTANNSFSMRGVVTGSRRNWSR